MALNLHVCPILEAFAEHLRTRIASVSEDEAKRIVDPILPRLLSTRVSRDPEYPAVAHPLEHARAHIAADLAMREAVTREAIPAGCHEHAAALIATPPFRTQFAVPAIVRRLEQIRVAHADACSDCAGRYDAADTCQPHRAKACIHCVGDTRCMVHARNVTAAACAAAAVRSCMIGEYVYAARAAADAFYGEAEVDAPDVSADDLRDRWEAGAACLVAMIEAQSDHVDDAVPPPAPMPPVVAPAAPVGRVVEMSAVLSASGEVKAG